MPPLTVFTQSATGISTVNYYDKQGATEPGAGALAAALNSVSTPLDGAHMDPLLGCARGADAAGAAPGRGASPGVGALGYGCGGLGDGVGVLVPRDEGWEGWQWWGADVLLIWGVIFFVLYRVVQSLCSCCCCCCCCCRCCGGGSARKNKSGSISGAAVTVVDVRKRD